MSLDVLLPGPDGLALLLGAAGTGAAAGVGALLGRACRSLPAGVSAVLAFMLAVPIPIFLIPYVPMVGALDLLFFGTALALGAVCGRIRWWRGEFLMICASILAGLGIVEAMSRYLSRGPTDSLPPHQARLFFPPASWDGGCEKLYAPMRAERDVEHGGIPRPVGASPVVGHFGDSMTYGAGVETDEAFPALMARMQPSVDHRNWGVPTVGTDYELQLFRSVVLHHRLSEVLLHVYVGNDVFDIDRPYECCDAGPLLTYEEGEVRGRCPTPRWRIGRESRIAGSPAPYFLRVASQWSVVASQLSTLLTDLAHRMIPPPHFIASEGEAREEGWAHLVRILAAWRDEARRGQMSFRVVLLPHRQSLERENATESPPWRARLRTAQVARDLGIPVLDAWDVFAQAVARDGARRYFLDRLGKPDIHFSPEGHRLLAEWLVQHLAPEPPPEPANRPTAGG